MVKDLSPKKQEKALVQAAITALKAKGAAINAYTVASEAQLSRSAIYRNPELVDLIDAERGEPSSAPAMTNDDELKRISELEERCRELEETIWNLEKKNEALTKASQDSYRLGFEAGVEDATKRYSALVGAAPAAETDEIGSQSQPASTAAITGDFAPLPTDYHVGADYVLYSEDVMPDSALAGGALTGGVFSDSVFSDSVMSESVMSESVVAGSASLDSALSESVLSGSALSDRILLDTALSGSVLSERVLSDSVLADSVLTGSALMDSSLSDSVLTGSAMANDVLLESTQAEPEQKPGKSTVTDAPSQIGHAAQGAETFAPSNMTMASLVSEVTAAPSNEHNESHASRFPRGENAIYNVVHSGPVVSTDGLSAIAELSWKDLEAVYHFNFASLGDFLPNSQSSQYWKNVNERLKQFPKTSPTTSDSANQTAQKDPSKSSERLKAHSNPADSASTESNIDLDALDIFDNLGEYVDADVVAKAGVGSDPDGSGGDELRELIKGRIKQAADIPHEQTTRTTAPPPKDGDAQVKAGGRNKFVGGKAAQEPVAPAQPMVRSIPPEIRKACMILGLKADELNQKLVYEAWKKQIAAPGVHPDLGGDTEAAIFLNTAKDTLVRWLDKQAPKLGKKFGGKMQSTQNRMPGAEQSTDKSADN